MGMILDIFFCYPVEFSLALLADEITLVSGAFGISEFSSSDTTIQTR
jgi:hypothetical protein